MGYYNGGSFVIRRIVDATAPGFCELCNKPWPIGEKIVFADQEVGDYVRFHVGCAEADSRNVANFEPTASPVDPEGCTEGTQREMILFTQAVRHAEVWFDPRAPKSSRYRFRIVE